MILSRLIDPLAAWWRRLTPRERLLIGLLGLTALFGGSYAARVEADARAERLAEIQTDIAGRTAPALGAWTRAEERAQALRADLAARSIAGESGSQVRETIRAAFDQAGRAAGLARLDIRITLDDAPAGASVVRYARVTMAGPFNWDGFLRFRRDLDRSGLITGWESLNFDESGVAQFQGIVLVAYRMEPAT